MKRVCLYCVLLWAAVACAPGDNKYSERDFVGIWVEPVPGMAGVQGIALEEDGAAHSVNMATLRYETWKYEKGSVVLTGMSIGNGVTIPFSDTVKVEGLTEDSLLLSRGETVLHRYRRSVEECGFSANPGEIVRGTVTFAHEVRTFRPLNDTAVYWLVDRSGYLQQRYLDSGRPEWQADADWRCGVSMVRRRNLPNGTTAFTRYCASWMCGSDSRCRRNVFGVV